MLRAARESLCHTAIWLKNRGLANVRKIQGPKQRLIFKGNRWRNYHRNGCTFDDDLQAVRAPHKGRDSLEMDASIAANHRQYAELSAYNNTVCYSALKHLPNATSPPSFRPAFPRQPMFIVLALDVVADDAIYPVFSRAVVARACNTCGELRHFDDWANLATYFDNPLLSIGGHPFCHQTSTSPSDDLRHIIFLAGRLRRGYSSATKRLINRRLDWGLKIAFFIPAMALSILIWWLRRHWQKRASWTTSETLKWS